MYPRLSLVLLNFKAKTKALDESSRRVRNRDGELEDLLKQKDEELEVYKTGMDTALLQLKELQLVICIVVSLLTT
jgi:huntingtin-interacting protein 1-related protein